MDVKVEVEYCGSCGYGVKFEEMANAIRTAVPTAEVQGKEGRTGAFEVSVNGTPIYSKLSTMAFPDFKNVTDIISDVADGKDVTPVSKQQRIECTIF